MKKPTGMTHRVLDYTGIIVCAQAGCGDTFRYLDQLEDHYHYDHSDIWCEDCKRNFAEPSHLETHMRSWLHSEATFPCPGKKCKKWFISFACVVQRLESGWCRSRITRPQLDKYVAENDLRGAITDTTRLQTSDGGQRTYEPPPVTKADESDLEVTSRGRYWQCPLCEARLATQGRLDMHLVSPKHYTGYKLYKCAHDACQKEFGALSCLLAHVRDGRCGAKKSTHVQTVFDELAASMATLRVS